MAYADFTFYSDSYHGDTLTDENAEKWLDRASDELDTITFGRLTFAFPTHEAHIARVKKAACAIAEALCLIDLQRKAASVQRTEDGSYRGAVASITSGKESISYAVGSAAGTAYSAAAANPDAEAALILSIATRYLANIPDANGINLLYAGGVGRVPKHGDGV